MSISTAELTIPNQVSPETVPDEQIRTMYDTYCETTPLRPVDYEIYEHFTRAVLLPLNQSLEQWKQSRPELITIDLRDAYEYVLIELISRLPEALEENLEPLMQIMRCISPLPAGIYPDEFFRNLYNTIYLNYMEKYPNPAIETISLVEYASSFRAVHEVINLFIKVLRKVKPGISYLEESIFTSPLRSAMLWEYQQSIN